MYEFRVNNSQRPIVCVADNLEFVVVTSTGDNSWSAERFTVDQDCSCIRDSIKLQDPTSKPSFLVKIDDYGCVCGVDKNQLTIWFVCFKCNFVS